MSILENNDGASKISFSKTTKGVDKVSFFVLVALVFLLPLFFLPFPQFPFLFSKSILVSVSTLILSVLWLIARLKDGKFMISKHPIVVLGASIPVVYLLSSLLSGSIGTSIIGQGFEIGTFTSIFLMVSLMFLTSSILKTKKDIYYIFLTFFISLFILSIYQVLRLIFGVDFLSFGVMTTSTSNLLGKWNELSVLYGITTILSLMMIEFVDFNKMIKVISYIILLISLFFIALINFGVIWILLGIFAFILFAFILSSNRFVKKPEGFTTKKFPAVSIVVILLALVFVIGGASVGGKLSEKFGINGSEVRPSLLGTYDVSVSTLKTNQAFLGAGPNKFVNQWLKFKPQGVNETEFWNTDFNTGVSFIISSLVNVGLIGFLLWVSFLGFLFYVGFKSIFIPSEDKANRYLLPFSFLTMVYLWLLAIIYVPTIAVFTMTFIFTGAFISLLVQNDVIKFKHIVLAKTQRGDFITVLILIFLILSYVVAGYILVQKFISSTYSQKGLIEAGKPSGNLSEAEMAIIKAINTSENDSYYRFLAEINLVKLQGLLSNKSLSEEELKNQFQAIMNDSVVSARRATELDKTNYQNWITLGKVYEALSMFGIEGAYDQSINSYIKAANLNPRNPLLVFTLGVFKYNEGKYQEAMPILEQAVILKPAYSDAKYYLGLSYYKLDRINDAIIQFEGVSELNPDNKEVKKIIANLKGGYAPFVETEVAESKSE